MILVNWRNGLKKQTSIQQGWVPGSVDTQIRHRKSSLGGNKKKWELVDCKLDVSYNCGTFLLNLVTLWGM